MERQAGAVQRVWKAHVGFRFRSVRASPGAGGCFRCPCPAVPSQLCDLGQITYLFQNHLPLYKNKDKVTGSAHLPNVVEAR